MDAPPHRQKEPQQLHGSGRRPHMPPPMRPSASATAGVAPSHPTAKGAATDAATQKRRKQRQPKSLLLLLKSFVGLRVRIDLKNDSVIEGVVEEVVHDMDFTMIDACETKPNFSTPTLCASGLNSTNGRSVRDGQDGAVRPHSRPDQHHATPPAIYSDGEAECDDVHTDKAKCIDHSAILKSVAKQRVHVQG